MSKYNEDLDFEDYINDKDDEGEEVNDPEYEVTAPVISENIIIRKSLPEKYRKKIRSVLITLIDGKKVLLNG